MVRLTMSRRGTGKVRMVTPAEQERFDENSWQCLVGHSGRIRVQECSTMAIDRFESISQSDMTSTSYTILLTRNKKEEEESKKESQLLVSLKLSLSNFTRESIVHRKVSPHIPPIRQRRSIHPSTHVCCWCFFSSADPFPSAPAANCSSAHFLLDCLCAAAAPSSVHQQKASRSSPSCSRSGRGRPCCASRSSASP